MQFLRRFLQPRPLRLAIISTPRSGNTWLRGMLGEACELPTQAAHHPDEIDWSGLPERCLVQLHWPPTRKLRKHLRRFGFQTITIARHPFDVLVSILHFCNHEPETGCWLDGLDGDETSLRGASPLDPQFLAYCQGARSDALLSVSSEWWTVRGVLRTKYEDLVLDPAAELTRILEEVDHPTETVPRAIEAGWFDRLKAQNRNQHYWQGKPDLWRDLFPAALASKIAAVHLKKMNRFDYSVIANETLTPEQALQNWQTYARS